MNFLLMSVVLSDTPLLVNEVLWFHNTVSMKGTGRNGLFLFGNQRLNKDAGLGK